ncbi:YhcH/YjgK/YiaL family protein [bacterium BFN5]|nr:YhcH/YjgK/YiaL family protein [bacterium BFN5]QJW49016.1 YhcH/YjgK/YiaL family protein [bacterium BFN5]
MIIGNIANLDRELNQLPTALQKGLKYLTATNVKQLPVGRYDIEGDNLFALVSNYKPQPQEHCKAETHVKYIDIQFIVSGEELMGYSAWSTAHEILEDCSAERDAIFYKTVDNESNVLLSEGTYAILFPWDVHRPCGLGAYGGEVKKVVLKIAMDLLNK